jgi:hypothetical protein
MARDPELDQPVVAEPPSAEIGKPDQQDAYTAAEPDLYAGIDEVDKRYWLACLDDAERAERSWRVRGREVVDIYRNEARASRGRAGVGPVTFNILFSNTEVMLGSVYQKPPAPVVRSRFVKIQQPMQPPTLAPPGLPPMPGLGGLPGGPPPIPPPLGAGPPGIPPPMALAPPLAGLPPELGAGASPMALDAGLGAPPPMGMPPIDNGPPPPSTPFGALPGMPQPPMPGMPQAAPGRPEQGDIETAASIMEKTLEIVLDDEGSNEAIKTAIKDVLLPGRGICRVRWRPQMETKPVEDPVMGGPLMHPQTGEPQTEEVKVWESVGDEYVFWEDFLLDPVRQANDTQWVAFRHLFSEKELDAEFAGSPEYEGLKSRGKVSDILKWTEESAAKSPPGGGSATKSAATLGNELKKAMLWEIWDKPTQKIIWFIRETTGMVLRVDDDSYKLQGFFPIPIPMLAVRTSDSRIPRPYYDLYSDLASDLDETSKRISALTKQIKVRGGYNSASRDVAGLLKAEDGKMLPIDGVDMLQGGLQNHLWLVPIDMFAIALEKLYLARDQQKMAVYEIMGISDIMRGATNPGETATAQRIKGSMGVSRLEDAKQQASNFVRDLMRLKAELIAQNFDVKTLEAMTGELITPEVEAILRSDFQRICAIDIEADSTVEIDEQAEQEAMAMTMQAIQSVMMGTGQMLQTGILPPPMVMQLSLELLKMFLHPIRYSRGVVELIDDFQEQLTAQVAMLSMMPPGMAPPGGPPGAPGGAPGPGGPPPGGGPPPPPGGPPPGLRNGAAPPPMM